MSDRFALVLLALPLALAACNDNSGLAAQPSTQFAESPAAQTSSTEVAETSTETAKGPISKPYRDVLEVFHDRDHYERYLEFQQRLAERFKDICGDTFCGGDYADLAPTGLTCSASGNGATIKECLWAFGGSQAIVDGATGSVRVHATTFACTIPVRARTTSFVTAMSASADPLYEIIPGHDRAFVDGLYACLQTSAPLPEAPPGRYVDAIEGASDEELVRFIQVRSALTNRFDETCGDTFCRGEYPAIAPLNLRCSLDQQTGEIGACTWAFSAASPRVDTASGAVIARQQTFTCPLPVHGPFVEFLAALGNAEDPLTQPLPHSTLSINDALTSCLVGP
jgi:hypothetical protein